MIKNSVWSGAAGGIVGLAVILTYTGAKNDMVAAQDVEPARVAGNAKAGPIDTRYVAMAKEVVLGRLPPVSPSGTGGVRASQPALRDPAGDERAALKAQAALTRFTPTAPILTPPRSESASDTPSAILNFDGDFQGLSCSPGNPADTALAIGDGSNPIVQMVTGCLSVWAPNGSRLSGPVSLQTFFGLNANTIMARSRAEYDWYNHRFIVLAIDTDYASNNNYDIGLSQSDDPTAGWWTYRIPVPSHSHAVPDFPRLGQDRTVAYPGYPSLPGALYVASNLYDTSNQQFPFIGEEWLLLPKGPMYSGAQFQMAFTSGMTTFGVWTDSSQPANVWSPYETPRAEFLVTSRNLLYGGGSCVNGCNGLTIWAVSNPFSFVNGGPYPDISGAVIGTFNSYFLSPHGQQPGGPNNIETFDTRISGQASYAHGFIYAALNAANGTGGTESIFYRIRPFLNRNNDFYCSGQYLNLCPEITAAGTFSENVLNYGTTTAAFFPTPQPDLEGNMTMVFNYSSSVVYPSLYYISQRFSQGTIAGGWTDTGQALQAGLGQYTDGQRSWGLYTAVAPVGVAFAGGNGGATGSPSMVFAGMYASSSDTWRTRIGANRFNAPSQP